MNNSPLIQLVRVGNMWRVLVNGVTAAFCVNYLAARYRAEQIEAQLLKQGGAA